MNKLHFIVFNKLHFIVFIIFIIAGIFVSHSTCAAQSSSEGNKIGVILGPNAINKVINKIANVGSWYYTYGPYPNRRSKNETLEMSFSSGKEFVPMINTRYFFLDDTYSADKRCALAPFFVTDQSPLCMVININNSLQTMLDSFKGHPNPPKYLMFSNEPWHRTAASDNIPWQGRNIILTPRQAAQAMSIIQPAVKELGLKLVSPTIDDADNFSWFSDFLKRCVEIDGCDIDAIDVFSAHRYRCIGSEWISEFVNKQYQTRLFQNVRDYTSAGMTPDKWQIFINRQKIWVTETTCNQDSDFRQAELQPNPQYPIRTQVESCLRASGQHPDDRYSSLPELLSMTDDQVERVAWWTTYAPSGFIDTDFAPTEKNPSDRIRAARLFYELGNFLTPVGRLIKQAYNNPKEIKAINCEHS